MPTYSPFGPRLKEHTAKIPERQSVTAERLGVTPSYISQLFKGRYNPSRELVEKAIETYELPAEQWLALAGYSLNPVADPTEELITRAAEAGARKAIEGVAASWDWRFHMADVNASPEYQLAFARGAIINRIRRAHDENFRRIDDAYVAMVDRLIARGLRPPNIPLCPFYLTGGNVDAALVQLRTLEELALAGETFDHPYSLEQRLDGPAHYRLSPEWALGWGDSASGDTTPEPEDADTA